MLPWKNNTCYILWMCVCGLRYPANNAHSLYCHLQPSRLYNTFRSYLKKKGTIFEKKFIVHKMCVLIFSTSFWNIYDCMKNWAKCDQTFMLVFTWSIHYSFQILMKLEFLNRFSKKKNSNINFHENPSIRGWIIPYGQRDRQDGARSQFCERAKNREPSHINL